MLSHVLLGLLRDGRPRHGYQLIRDYRERAGLKTNPGNLYRALAKLVQQGLIETEPAPPDVDDRRIPYRITRIGREGFDGWLLDRSSPEADLDSWLLFADLLGEPDRGRLLRQLEDELWVKTKAVARAREDRAARRRGLNGYDPAQLLLSRRTKALAVELEFLDELRRQLDGLPRDPAASRVQVGSPTGAGDAEGYAAAGQRIERR